MPSPFQIAQINAPLDFIEPGRSSPPLNPPVGGDIPRLAADLVKHRKFPLLILLLLISCTPVQTGQTPPETTSAAAEPPPTPTLSSFSTPTITTPVEIPTSTPVPCDPRAEEFCISEGHFVLQRPIRPPGNDAVDITYRYGTTAKKKRDPHHGVEFLNRFGTPVHAAGDGEVVFAGMDEQAIYSPWRLFYGNLVVIRHADELYTLYAHLSAIDVQAGQRVSGGEKIGEVGQTGAATGSHLHFEVRRGGDGTAYFSTQNPELWLIPQNGLGVLSITVMTGRNAKFEREVVVTGESNGRVYYVSTYAKGFENNGEDAVIGDAVPGRYRIVFYERGVLYERWAEVQAGKLTEVFFILDK